MIQNIWYMCLSGLSLGSLIVMLIFSISILKNVPADDGQAVLRAMYTSSRWLLCILLFLRNASRQWCSFPTTTCMVYFTYFDCNEAVQQYRKPMHVINGDFPWPCELPAQSFAQRNLSITQIHQPSSVNIASVAKCLA